jgi:dolichol-phosphate mannosyltransferase
MKKITLVIPVFNEANCIEVFYRATSEVISKNKDFNFHFLFVDDGSSDKSFEIISKITRDHQDISCIKLTRNFGKEAAIFAALSSLNTDAAIVIDCDLQHPPSLIENFIEQWKAGYLVVCGVRITSDSSSLIRKTGSFIFYKIMNLVSNITLKRGITDFCLIDHKVIQEILRFPESNRLFRGILHWMGFKTAYVDFHAPQRSGGSSSFYFRNLMSLGINGITSFSLFPLRLIGWFGVVLSLVSGVLFLVMLFDKFLFNYNHFAPISYVIVVNTFFIGLLGMSMGLMAIYIGNIYTDVRKRPLYIVEDQI